MIDWCLDDEYLRITGQYTELNKRKVFDENDI